MPLSVGRQTNPIHQAKGTAMKKTLILVLSMIWLAMPPAQAEQHVAMIKKLTDQAEIKRNGETISAREGLVLLNTDSIHTPERGYVGITFLDGTAITIGPNSDFRIDRYVFEPNTEVYDFTVYLNKGSALFKTGKIARLSPKSVNLKTARAIVGIRGTRFIVEVQ
jgi:hypothetical protein